MEYTTLGEGQKLGKKQRCVDIKKVNEMVEGVSKIAKKKRADVLYERTRTVSLLMFATAKQPWWVEEMKKKRMLELNSLKEGNPDVMLQTRYLENQF